MVVSAVPREADAFCKKLLTAVIAFDLLVGVWLRFRTTSKLWLDEALSVNIASHPIGAIPNLLRHDGAPPLYYYLLHSWMNWFGRGDVSVRSLSGLLSVATLPVAYFAAKRWFSKRTAAISIAVVAVIPYAVYFATEARMYALEMLLSALLFLVLHDVLFKPRWRNGFVLVLILILMLYTQYWSLYLLAVLGVTGVVVWRRSLGGTKQSATLLLSVAIAGIAFLPWLTVFNDQRLHTGTPWAGSASFADIFTWLGCFSVNQSVHYIVSSLHLVIGIDIFLAMLMVAVFARRMTRDRAELVLRIVPEDSVRWMSFLIAATMVVGMVASHFGHSTFVPRYASVIAIPLFVLVAVGIEKLNSSLRILLVLSLFSIGLLWTDHWGIGSQRTQSGQVAAALVNAAPDSVVFVCPDQLGPTLLRYSNPHLTYLGFPRLEDPSIVNWSDYDAAVKAARGDLVARRINAIVQSGRPLYVVWSLHYNMSDTCQNLLSDIVSITSRTQITEVTAVQGGFFQSMNLDYLPARAPEVSEPITKVEK